MQFQSARPLSRDVSPCAQSSVGQSRLKEALRDFARLPISSSAVLFEQGPRDNRQFVKPASPPLRARADSSGHLSFALSPLFRFGELFHNPAGVDVDAAPQSARPQARTGLRFSLE